MIFHLYNMKSLNNDTQPFHQFQLNKQPPQITWYRKELHICPWKSRSWL